MTTKIVTPSFWNTFQQIPFKENAILFEAPFFRLRTKYCSSRKHFVAYCKVLETCYSIAFLSMPSLYNHLAVTQITLSRLYLQVNSDSSN